jgi:hypothetical protein
MTARLVTEEALDAARQHADTVAAELADAEAKAADRAGALPEREVVDLSSAAARASLAAARVRQLERQAAEQGAELAARGAAEEAAAGFLQAVGAELDASAAAVLGTLAAAEAALLAAVTAAAGHTMLVAEVRAELVALGLGLADVAEGIEHQTGAGQRVGVRIGGRWWHPASPPAVLALAAGHVAVAALGPGHPLVARLAGPAVPLDVGRRTDGLLDGLPTLPQTEQPARLRPQPAAVSPDPGAADGPYLLGVERLRLGGSGGAT